MTQVKAEDDARAMAHPWTDECRGNPHSDECNDLTSLLKVFAGSRAAACAAAIEARIARVNKDWLFSRDARVEELQWALGLLRKDDDNA